VGKHFIKITFSNQAAEKNKKELFVEKSSLSTSTDKEFGE